MVNACNAPTWAIESAAEKMCNMLMIEAETKSDRWKFGDSKKLMKKHNATAAVFVTKDPTLPLSLIAMEEKWGMVNAEGLSVTNLHREVVRVATVVLGGASSKYDISAMRPAFSASDLDKVGDIIAIDSIMAIFPNIEALGFKRYEIVSYQDALECGCAPEPVNDVQRKLKADYEKAQKGKKK